MISDFRANFGGEIRVASNNTYSQGRHEGCPIPVASISSCSKGYLNTTAQPKSIILTIPSSLTQQLSNFKSRCARPISCKYRHPATICFQQHPISSSVCFPVITIANCKLEHHRQQGLTKSYRQYSMTSKYRPASLTMSNVSTIFW
jgi:hypothetical protein